MLNVENIIKTYNRKGGGVQALNGVSFSLEKGEFLVIMGSSGSGKSTLLNILGALDSPDGGKIYLDGTYDENYHKEPMASKYREKNIGFIFQGFRLLKDLTVEENIAVPLILKKLSAKEIKDRVNVVLEKMDLMEHRNHKPVELSGGQQQRVAIGRAIINNPPLLLADEPTGNLDYNTSKEILKVIQKMNRELDQSIIMVTHDPLVASYGDRVLFLKDGKKYDEYKICSKEDAYDYIINKFKEINNDNIN